MPKRKKDDSYEHLLKKLKKLNKKIQRHCSPRRRSQEREHFYQNTCNNLDDSNRVAGSLDGNDNEPQGLGNIEPTSASTAELITEFCTDSAANATSADDIPIPGTSTGRGINENLQSEECAIIPLDDAILEILGDDPTISTPYGNKIHKDLAIRLEHIATQGLSKEVRKELTEKYLLPSNCKLTGAPALNAEMKAAISEATAKRDKSIEFRQKQNATAISCLSQVINKLFSNKEADPADIKRLMDAQRILCDLQHHDSTVRRSFILSSVKRDIKEQLQNTKTDNMLFGQDLGETLKTAKAISKSGADLKAPVPKPPQTTNKKPPVTTNSSKNLNWKGPYPPRKQPPYQNHPRTKDPPPPQNRNRLYNSSRPSQPYQPRGRR